MLEGTYAEAPRQPAAREAGALPRCRSLIMVGTDPEGPGGVSAVVRGYRESGLLARLPCDYVVTHRPGGAGPKFLTAARGLLRILGLLLVRPEPLLHLHMASRASFWRKSIVAALAQLLGRPYLVHLHGGGFAEFYEHECGPLARRWVRRVLRRAAVVLALTETWRARLASIEPAARIEVLPNGIALPGRATDAGAAPPQDAPTDRASLAAPRLLFLGDLIAAKGVPELLRVFVRLGARLPNLRLVCAGPGDREALRAACPAALRERLELPGWIDPPARARELARATVFVLPSHREGLPMALLEAMGAGCAVVASRVGGIPQVLTDGVNGLLIEPHDEAALEAALARLLGDAQLRARLGRAARTTVERDFGLEQSCAALLAIYARFGIASR